MTLETSAFSFDQCPPARRVSDDTVGPCDRGGRPQVRDDALGLILGHVAAGHRSTRNAIPDDSLEFRIRQLFPELSSREVDARHLVAVGTMAVRADVLEHPAAPFDPRRA